MWQGEVLAGVRWMTLDPESITEEQPRALLEDFAFAIIVGQDCDLERDFEDRQQGRDSALRTVLMIPAWPATELRASLKASINLGTDEWKLIRQNNNQRFHCIEQCPEKLDAEGTGLPALGMDFRQTIGIPPAEIYEWIRSGGTRKRFILAAPYVEDLSSRWSFYQHRVALPQPYKID
ncbi:MAG: hypothetical protein JSS66_14550 [Armatimonadetes bacterium]|nr:hypothetical protein [Armatimonadota bacterium]